MCALKLFLSTQALKSLTISDNLFGGGRDDGDIAFRLESRDDDAELMEASKELKTKLKHPKRCW